MKKIISFVLAAVLLVSAVPTALATNDYSQGTQVVYEATGSESYTITVPAQLAPGGSGTVTLEGTWADNRIITVTADPTVTLTNSIKAEDQKVLNVHFDGISEAGSNIGSQTFTEGVSVDDITNALFGTWSGKFNYNVEVKGNMIPASSEFGYWDETGILVDSTIDKHTDYIDVEYGKTYRISDDTPNHLAALFDENYQFIDFISGNTNGYTNLDRYVKITDERAKYISINYIAPDEENIYMYEVKEEYVPTYSNKIGFLGDSITKGVISFDGKVSGTYFTYGSLVARDMNSSVKNYSNQGSKIAGSDSKSITNRASSMASDLDMIVVMGGINDFTSGTEAFGSVEDQTTDTFYGAMNVLLTTLTNKYADKPIVFLTPMDVRAIYGSTNEATGKTLDEYVAAIKEVCALYDNVTVIDTHAWAEQFNPEDKAWLCDGVHPSIEGHHQIAAFVYSQLIA